MDSLLKVAGQMVGGKGQSQGQGPSSGTSGLMHKITDVATGQSHPGDQRNQQPRGINSSPKDLFEKVRLT